MLRILVVEDDPSVWHVISAALIREKAEHRRMSKGELALQAALDYQPDLILLNSCLPDSDGREILRRLKAQPALKDTPVLFFTGLSYRERVAALAAGATECLAKPFSVLDLQDRLRSLAAAKPLSRT